ncbi:MAG: hypothetical protein FWD91_08120 [Treponema sp.]|nr:hypothetical protein [Treponema sp.]
MENTESTLVSTDHRASHADLALQVNVAKTDKCALNKLLHDYMPFIKKCVSGVFFQGQSKADNLTDAMLAFAHSVKTYDPEHGAFISYAATVIRNRLIDSARKELAVQKRFFLFSAKKNEEVAAWETNASLQSYDRAEEERNLHLEIEEVNREFSRWGFSWAALLKKCPKRNVPAASRYAPRKPFSTTARCSPRHWKNADCRFRAFAKHFPAKRWKSIGTTLRRLSYFRAGIIRMYIHLYPIPFYRRKAHERSHRASGRPEKHCSL